MSCIGYDDWKFLRPDSIGGDHAYGMIFGIEGDYERMGTCTGVRYR